LIQTSRLRGGLIFKAHRLLHHPTLGLRVIKKRRISRLSMKKPRHATSKGAWLLHGYLAHKKQRPARTLQ